MLILVFIQILIACMKANGISDSIATIRSDIDSKKLDSEIDQLTRDGRKVVAIVNEANDWFTLWCTLSDDDLGQYRIHKSRSIAISFFHLSENRLKRMSCTVDYKGYWAYFDTYREFIPHMNIEDNVFRYIVRDDGIYYNGKKISSLASGQTRYVLWEHCVDNKPSGRSLTGYVDSGTCNNLPDWMKYKTSGVTVCNHQCVILYAFKYCKGWSTEVRTNYEFCRSVCLNWYLNDKVESIKGC